VARNIAGLFTDLLHTPSDDIFNSAGIDAGAVNQSG